jgi:hypothetical protein
MDNTCKEVKAINILNDAVHNLIKYGYFKADKEERHALTNMLLKRTKLQSSGIEEGTSIEQYVYDYIDKHICHLMHAHTSSMDTRKSAIKRLYYIISSQWYGAMTRRLDELKSFPTFCNAIKYHEIGNLFKEDNLRHADATQLVRCVTGYILYLNAIKAQIK